MTDKRVHCDGGQNLYQTIDDLPLDNFQREAVLMWFAWKLWVLTEEGLGDKDYYGKTYDPLYITDKTAHTYVFDLEDGGRHHPFETLAQLEKQLVDEGIGIISDAIKDAKEDA